MIVELWDLLDVAVRKSELASPPAAPDQERAKIANRINKAGQRNFIDGVTRVVGSLLSDDELGVRPFACYSAERCQRNGAQSGRNDRGERRLVER